MKYLVTFLCAGLMMTGCATTSGPSPRPSSDIVIASPDLTPTPAPDVTSPPPEPPAPPREAPAPDILDQTTSLSFDDLDYWHTADLRPGLSAFKRSCKRWANAELSKPLSPHLSDYGVFGDWEAACAISKFTPDTQTAARRFFENEFYPVTLDTESGLLTGYYQPEISVKTVPDAAFSEPILARPASVSVQKRPRSQLGPKSSRVIAYGRPMDVFFMQIQGSGHLRFEDGRVLRAAYNGNNGYPYISIGRVLIDRGEIPAHKSSKRDIENWMAQAGAKKSRDLMNENKRYIFFKEQAIEAGAGPVGAMQVPLTAMGSIAVDPRYHPYGTPVFLNVKLPQRAGDYKGKDTGVLVVAQDTGKAIRGAYRADLFFGSGLEAGQRAGVMKHSAQWTILLPRGLVLNAAPIS